MRLTPDYIESQVESVEYTYSGTLTIATVLTKSGTKLVGHSACLDPKNYDRAVGEQIARKNAVEQLWALEGYYFAKLSLSRMPLAPEEAAALLAEKVGACICKGTGSDAQCELLPAVGFTVDAQSCARNSTGPDGWTLLPDCVEPGKGKA